WRAAAVVTAGVLRGGTDPPSRYCRTLPAFSRRWQPRAPRRRAQVLRVADSVVARKRVVARFDDQPMPYHSNREGTAPAGPQQCDPPRAGEHFIRPRGGGVERDGSRNHVPERGEFRVPARVVACQPRDKIESPMHVLVPVDTM